MAGPCVAAGFGEERHDVGAQSGRPHPGCPLNSELDGGVAVSEADNERSVAVGAGGDEAVPVDFRDRSRLDAEAALSGDVAHGAVSLAKRHGKLLLSPAADQVNGCRLDFEAGVAGTTCSG